MPDPLSDDASALVAALDTRMRELQVQLLARKSPNTLRAYSADLRDFDAYCRARGMTAVPAAPRTIASYVLALAERGMSPSTILRRHASISMAHRLAGHRLSEEGEAMIRPLFAVLRQKLAFSSRKAVLDIGDLHRLLSATPQTATGARDRALVLLGFAGDFGSSELVSLDVEDIDVTDRQLYIRMRRLTSTSSSPGRVVVNPHDEHLDTSPVRALLTWYSLSGIRSGPLFRPINCYGRVGTARLSTRAVAPIIKRMAQRAGLDPRHYAGQSLHAGHGGLF
jgi:site-specific recombinase XerC